MRRLALFFYDLFGLARSRLWRIANPPKKPRHWWEESYWYEVKAYDRDGNPLRFAGDTTSADSKQETL